MVLYLVRTRNFTTQGNLYHRGDVILPDMVRNPSVKVSDGKLVKIDTANPRWIREVNKLGQRVGMPMMGRVKAKIAEIEAQELVAQELAKEALAAQVAATVPVGDSKDAQVQKEEQPEKPKGKTQPKASAPSTKDVAAILAKAQAAAQTSSVK